MISHVQKHKRLRILQGSSYQRPADTNISCQPLEDLFHRAEDDVKFLEERHFIMRQQQQGDDFQNTYSTRIRRARSSSVSGGNTLPSATVVTPRSYRSECEKDLLEMIDEILNKE
jgi:hypothetical protein